MVYMKKKFKYSYYILISIFCSVVLLRVYLKGDLQLLLISELIGFLFLSILLHEMGHIIAAKFCELKIIAIYFGPFIIQRISDGQYILKFKAIHPYFFGATLFNHSPKDILNLDKLRKSFEISIISGPLTNLFISILVMVFYVFTGIEEALHLCLMNGSIAFMTLIGDGKKYYLLKKEKNHFFINLLFLIELSSFESTLPINTQLIKKSKEFIKPLTKCCDFSEYQLQLHYFILLSSIINSEILQNSDILINIERLTFYTYEIKKEVLVTNLLHLYIAHLILKEKDYTKATRIFSLIENKRNSSYAIARSRHLLKIDKGREGLGFLAMSLDRWAKGTKLENIEKIFLQV